MIIFYINTVHTFIFLSMGSEALKLQSRVKDLTRYPINQRHVASIDTMSMYPGNAIRESP